MVGGGGELAAAAVVFRPSQHRSPVLGSAAHTSSVSVDSTENIDIIDSVDIAWRQDEEMTCWSGVTTVRTHDKVAHRSDNLQSICKVIFMLHRRHAGTRSDNMRIMVSSGHS